jgi:hypothetical protein
MLWNNDVWDNLNAHECHMQDVNLFQTYFDEMLRSLHILDAKEEGKIVPSLN